MNEQSHPNKALKPRLRYLGRIALIVIQLTLVYLLSGDFQPFFYQAF